MSTPPKTYPQAQKFHEAKNCMRAAFLRALEHRIAADVSGAVVLPTGIAELAEIAKVLRAIERARQSH